MTKKLSDDDRRRMILEALEPGASIQRVAVRYGLHRNSLYQHFNQAVTDPEEKLREAEAEAAFRRKVVELSR